MRTFQELKEYYDNEMNCDKSTYLNSNDETTPIDCVCEMINKIPNELWKRKELKILDPCCGNGNFFIPIFFKLKSFGIDEKTILQNILSFNDTNEEVKYIHENL
jgi:hypothetical protein